MGEPTTADEAFVAYAPCGHIVAATWIDGNPKRAAKTAGAWLARGDEVRRVSGEKVRNGEVGQWCKCGREARDAARQHAGEGEK